MFKCNSCGYLSNRKYNLQKHLKSIHKRDGSDEELTCIKISSELSKNSSKISKISSDFSKNSSEISKISSHFEKKFSCEKCFKNFNTFQCLKRHSDVCKGTSNPLECHFCHQNFATYQSKSKHIKVCKIRKAQEQVQTMIQSLPAEYNNTNNITNNNNTNNANNQQIIYQINNYRISNDEYNSKYDHDLDHEDIEQINDFGKEDISYIGTDQMHQIALNCDFKTLIREKHFNPEHPENHNIRNNCNKSYKVLKDNKWLVEPKDTVCSVIYNNSKAQVYDYAFQNLLHQMLDDDQSDQYLLQWQQYEKSCKKKLYNYIEVQIKELMKQRRLRMIEANKDTKTIDANKYITNTEIELQEQIM